MALRRNNITGDFLGDLDYSRASLPIVAPPKNLPTVLNARENQYLQSVENKQALEDMVATLPHTKVDEPLYNELVGNTNSFLGSITPDNMADSVLNTQQFSKDFANKMGGRELLQNYQQYQNAIKTIDDNKDIPVDMKDWYKSKIKVSPVQKSNVTGRYSTTPINPVRVAPYVDIGKELVDLFEGMKADKNIQENPDGTITILRPVPGYLQYNVGETVSRERLEQGIAGYINSRPDVTEYFGQRAEFMSDQVANPTVAFYQSLSPENKQELLGNPNATLEEVNTFLMTNNINPKKALQTVYKAGQLSNAMQPAISKYVYSQTTPTLVEDWLLKEYLKTQADLAKEAAKSAKPAPEDLSSVSLLGWNTVQNVNTQSYEALSTDKTALATQTKDLQREITQYQNALNNKESGYTQEELNRKNQQMAILDDQIEQIEQQQKNINEGVFDIARKNGIDINSEYDKRIPTLTKEANYVNRTQVLSDGRVDVTDKINFIGQTPMLYGTEVYALEQGQTTEGRGVAAYGNNPIIRKETVNGKTRYTYSGQDNKQGVTTLPANYKVIQDRLTQDFISPRGEIISPEKVLNLDYTVNTNTVKVPTKEEYLGLVTDEYAKDSSSFLTPNTKSKNGFIFTNGDRGLARDIEKKAGEFDIDVTRDLSYIYSTGAASKQSIKKYDNYVRKINHNMRNNPETYLVGDKPLSTALSEMGVDNLSTHVDWSKSTIYPLLQRDRKNGQMYGINIILTKEGRESLDGDAQELYSNTNSIKLPATYHGTNKSTEEAEIQDTLLTAFKDIMASGNTQHDINVLKATGETYINTTPEGKAIDAANLYVLPPGKAVDINMRGLDLQIESSARTARGSNVANTDFRVSKGTGKSKQYLSQLEDGTIDWLGVEESKGKVKDFNSPSDIKQFFGASMLQEDMTKQQQTTTPTVTNPYEAYIQGATSFEGSGYTKKTSNDIQVTNYGSYTRSFAQYYDEGSQTIGLKNSSGKTSYLTSRVPLSDLSDMRDFMGANIASNVSYPYINKSIASEVKSLVTDNNLLVSGGFRGEDTHNHLKGSNSNSPHKYGYALDLEDNEEGNNFFTQVNNDAALMKRYNIARILKEDDHIHVEFNTKFI